jgi:putative NADH-flavin reductase
MTVFGAFGSVGRQVAEEARRRGHEVTAVSRRPGSGSEVGDARVVADVVRLGKGRDVLIGATRPADGEEGQLVEATRALLAGAAETGARLLLWRCWMRSRCLAIGGFGSRLGIR